MAEICVRSLVIFALISAFCPVSYGMIEGIYCGTENCYDVLGVTRDSRKSEIAKAYRKLARKFHPDVYKGKDAETKFQLIATAYEVLKDDESRADYDYMLDNPEEVYRHYYHYYRHRVAPKVDVRIVIAVTITVISVLQYLHRWQRYYDAVNYALTVPKYRFKATQIAKDEGLLNGLTKRKTKRSKEELKEDEESILRSIVENNVDIRGGYSKPSLWDVLWVQIIISPYTITKYLLWCLWWMWKFNIRREEYGPEETMYLTRKRLGMTETQWHAMDEFESEKLISRELWISKNFQEYKREQEEEMRVQMAQNSRYKMYRRYMKNQGPGKITFAED